VFQIVILINIEKERNVGIYTILGNYSNSQGSISGDFTNYDCLCIESELGSKI